MNNKIMNMSFKGEDDWGNKVFKCIENNTYYKGLLDYGNKIELHTCGNEFDGEPGFPIKKDIKIIFIDMPENEPTREEKFNYMMLSRLESDCKYFLGNGNYYINHLYYKNVNEHIQEMKNLYNSFSDENKPQWITMEIIEEYCNKMNNQIHI